MADLLTNATSETKGTGQALSGPCTVYYKGVFDGAEVLLEAADTDKEQNYVPIDRITKRMRPGAVALNNRGAYYLRAKLYKPGAKTSITVSAIQ